MRPSPFSRLLVLSGLLFFSMQANSWEGYKTIYLQTQADEEKLFLLLEGGNFTGVLSYSSTLVSFQDFSSLEKISLKDLPKRLYPTDPRYDPFMKSLDKLFLSPLGGRWVYIPQEIWDKGFSNELNKSGIGWLEPGTPSGSVKNQGNPIQALLFLLFCFLLNKDVKSVLFPIVAITSFLGGVAVFFIGILAIPVAAAVIFYWKWQLGHDRESWERRASGDGSIVQIQSFSPFFLLVFLFPYLGKDILYFLSGITAGFLHYLTTWIVVKIYHGYWDHILKNLEHRIFIPHSLKKKKKSFLSYAFLALPILTLFPAVFIFQDKSQNLTPPWHQEFLEDQGGLLSFRELFKEEQSETLPGPASFIAHSAFQEGFAYGVTFTVPEEKPWTLPRYTRVNNRLVEEVMTVVDFGPQWYSRLKNSLGPQSAGSLLLSSHTPYRLIPGESSALPPEEVPLPLAGIFGLFFLGYYLDKTRTLNDNSNSFIHSKRQAA